MCGNGAQRIGYHLACSATQRVGERPRAVLPGDGRLPKSFTAQRSTREAESLGDIYYSPPLIRRVYLPSPQWMLEDIEEVARTAKGKLQHDRFGSIRW